MQCMEVWGGNGEVDAGVMMAGLDAWIYSRPFGGEHAGGDVYLVSSCATGRITRLLIADVSGHGSDVAATGVKLRQLMRRYINHIDQERFMLALNGEFTRLSRAGGFATAFVSSFFAPTNQLSFCRAGHPPALIRRAKAKRWELLTDAVSDSASPTNIPLGILESGAYESADVRLSVGDLVLAYTDGLIETRDRTGSLLGAGNLLEMINDLNPDDPARLIPDLRQAVASWSGSPAFETDDDATMLLIRPNGLAPRVPIAKRVLAPFRVASGVVRSAASGQWGALPVPQMSRRSLLGAMFTRPNRP